MCFKKVLASLASEHDVKTVTYERQTEPHNNARDKLVGETLQKTGVTVQPVVGHTLFDPDRMLKLNGGTAPLNMTGFQKLASKAGAPPKPQSAPSTYPPLPTAAVSGGKDFEVFDKVPTLSDFEKYGYQAENKTTTFIAGKCSF